LSYAVVPRNPVMLEDISINSIAACLLFRATELYLQVEFTHNYYAGGVQCAKYFYGRESRFET